MSMPSETGVEAERDNEQDAVVKRARVSMERDGVIGRRPVSMV
jgi:hypothetical protein